MVRIWLPLCNAHIFTVWWNKHGNDQRSIERNCDTLKQAFEWPPNVRSSGVPGGCIARRIKSTKGFEFGKSMM